MKDPASSIANYLVSKGVGAFADGSDWSIYVGKMPNEPLRCIQVETTIGGVPEPALALDYPAFRVRVRGRSGDYKAAYDKLLEVKNILLGMDPTDIDGDTWMGILMNADIHFVMYVNNEYPLWQAGFSAFVEPGDIGNRRSL